MAELIRTLEGIVGAEQVRTGDGARAYAVDGVAPKAVVFPGSVDEVSAVLRVCHAARAAVVPWGAGVHMGLGCVPKAVDVVLGLRRIHRLLDHEPGDMTSTVEAGMTLAEYQAQLGRHGQFLSLDPPGADRATVGGILAANMSGPRRLRYGTARDLLIGLRVVAADGTVTKGGAKVVKNVTGYDMNKLYVGSLGTLGLIVEATFRLYPIPACERTWVASFPTASKAREVVARILDSPLVPSAVELLNATAAREVESRSGLPSDLKGVVLAVAVASVPDAVDAQIRTAQGLANERGADRVLDGSPHDLFWSAVRDLGCGDGAGMVLKACILIARVADAIEQAERLAKQEGLRVAVISEAATGIVQYRFWAEDGAEDRVSRLARVVAPMRDFATEARGNLIVLQAPTAVKSRVDVWGAVGNGFALMRRLKEQYDPDRTLNPGRFVGGL